MAEPLSAEEREHLHDAHDFQPAKGVCPLCRYEATVQALEAERDRLRRQVRNALARLDGHTCHEGHTDADHLRLYRQVVGEIDHALAPDPPAGT